MSTATRRGVGAAVALALLSLVLMATAPTRASAATAATQVGPVPPSSDIVFFVRENDLRKVPAPGVVVTVTVVSGGTDGAAVAPTQRSGAATGPAAASAQSTSDNLGNAYFRLHAAGKSGTDTFTWTDGRGHTGPVAVLVSASATPAAGPVTASAVASPPATSSARPGTAVIAAPPTAATPTASTPWWRTLITGLVAVALAAALVFWLPRLVRRVAARRARVQSPDA
jgi:hypothetical protein